MKLVRTKQARSDLLDIWLHIAADNEAAATDLLLRIDGRCEALPDSPRMGPLRMGKQKAIRQLVEGEYLILYRIGRDAIEIIRVMHGRRDLSEF
ncbi:MAG TPA: type II toxin-antitoxin system RelE/ParE family toxin [Hyphomonadaceae bacterium]|nr:type II toxin-antitoxin system RelE/ParE family toxin [Hyphomonadaceae bacterium]